MMLRILRKGAADEANEVGPHGLIAQLTAEVDRFGTFDYGQTPNGSLAGIWGPAFPVARMTIKDGRSTAPWLVRGSRGTDIWVDSHQGRVYRPTPGCFGWLSRTNRAVRAEIAGRRYVYRFWGIASTRLTRDGIPVMFTSVLGRHRFSADADPTDIAVGLLIEWNIGREPMQIIG